MKTAYEKHRLKSYEIPKTERDVLEAICQYKKVTFIIFEYLAPLIQCDVTKIPTPVITGWNGVFLKEGTPYKTLFNRR